MSSARVHKTILNAKVNLIFYFLSLFFAFFSRKLFLDCLSAEFIGLTGTLGNILGYLNLAELGFGSAVSYFLFSPLQSDDRAKITEIVSVLGYIYKRLGQFILGGGIVVSLFFPLIFADAGMPLSIVYFSFYSFLSSSLIGYFINYRQILLVADQKNYLVTTYLQSASFIRIALQMFLAYYYRNLYLWVAVEFLFSLLGCIILNRKIDQEYPWLKVDKQRGKDLLKEYPSILSQTRQVFIHKIKDFLLSKSDEIFIFAFVSLKMVAFYGNYMLIINKLSLFCSSIFDGVGSGIGNLVAEGNIKNTQKVFWELVTARQFMAVILSFSIYFFIEPFICLWLGEEYVMAHTILVLLVIFLYISVSRVVVDMFNHAYGHYADVWAAWAELVINISVTLVCGHYFGIIGILLGKILSVCVIIILWKPYYLYSKGFKIPFHRYLASISAYYLIGLAVFALGYGLSRILPINPYNGFLQLILYAAIMTVTCMGAYLLLILQFGTEAMSIVNRLKNIVLRKH